MAPLPKLKFDYGLLAKLLSIVVIIEGGVIAANAHRVHVEGIEGIGGIKASTMQLAGIQLIVLGIIALVFLILPAVYHSDRKLISRVINLIPPLVALAVVAESLIVMYYSAPITLVGLGHVRSFWIAGFAAQLFLLGVGLLLSRALAGKESFGLTVITAVTLVLCSLGIFVMGISAETTIAGVGSVSESSVFIIGAQLSVVSAIVLVLLFLGNKGFLCRAIFGVTPSTLGIIALSVVLSIEGLVSVSYGAPITIQGTGTLSESTMLLFGLAIAFLGMAVPATIFSKTRLTRNGGNLAMYAVAFLVLLFPFALSV